MPDRMNPTQVDQECAYIRDTMPRLWRAIYQGSIDADFKPAEAFVLLQTWILAQNPNGIKPPSAIDSKNPES